jgi:hypothetical protein
MFRQALGHLHGLVDILGPCDHVDHHGYCQTHFVDESPCRVGKAREFLESLPNNAACGVSALSLNTNRYDRGLGIVDAGGGQ